MTFKLRHIFWALIAWAGLSSCSGDRGTASQELYLDADKTAILNDGQDAVNFRVWYGSIEEVTGSKDVTILCSINGGPAVTLPKDRPSFTSTAVGEYVFTAVYRTADGVEVRSKPLTVKVVKVETYIRRILAMQFTSTGCPNCPPLAGIVAEAKKDSKVSVAAFHTDYGNESDPMTIGTTRALAEHFGYVATFPLPFFALDMNLNLTADVNQERISAKIAERLAEPATCGVAISSSYRTLDRKLSIDVKVTSSTEAAYKFVILLVEDGIPAFQMGVEDGASYIHNNVVRKMLNMYVTGDDMNRKRAFSPGIEVVESREVTMDGNWNVENMRIIAAAMTLEDGIKYSCENVNECKAGSSADYLIKE